MKRIAMAASFCLVLLPFAGALSAGPLDRQNVQQRSNPVTQSMIRVPGVVGQEQAQAMMSIQAVGLNVSVKKAKSLPKGVKGAAGMEGRVVEQTPTAGGMAMYGTTVTLSVWKPGQSAAGTGTSTGTASWGAGSSPSSYTSQPGYPGGAAGTTMQQPYTQGGAMGGVPMQGGQGGQGFQVQQYYYPDGSGAGGQAQQGQPPASQQPAAPPQPMDPYGGQQGAAPQGGQAQPQAFPPPAQ